MGPTVVHATIQVKIKLKSMNQIRKTFLLRVVIADKCSKDKEVNRQKILFFDKKKLLY